MLTAKDLMTSDVVSIRPMATVQEAIDVLTRNGVSGLPVTDAHGHVLGIITEFALLAIAYDLDARNHPVSAHMTRNVISLQEDEAVSKIADLLILHRIRRVLVMRGDHLVGLVSRRDVLRAVSCCGEVVAMAEDNADSRSG